MLVIVLPLLSFMNLSMENDTSEVFPLEGRVIKDTTNAILVKIDDIKKANIKLNERLLYMQLNNYNDSIIADYKAYIVEQNNNILKLQSNIVSSNKLIDETNEQLEREIKRKNVWKYTALGTTSAVIILLIFGLLK